MPHVGAPRPKRLPDIAKFCTPLGALWEPKGWPREGIYMANGGTNGAFLPMAGGEKACNKPVIQLRALYK